MKLRNAGPDDAGFIEAAQSQPEIARFVSSAAQEEILASIDDPDQAYLIALDDHGEDVGFAYLRQVARPERSIELCRLAITRRDRGFGSRFLKLIMAEAFGPLQANRLWLDVFTDNDRARKVYRRCGFVEEGVLREAYFQDGRFHSAVVMSVLAREYAAMPRL